MPSKTPPTKKSRSNPKGLEERWLEIQATRPKGPNHEPRPGSTGLAYVSKGAPGRIEIVRVMARHGESVEVMRMNQVGNRMVLKLKDIRSTQELERALKDLHPKEVSRGRLESAPPDVHKKKMDIVASIWDFTS